MFTSRAEYRILLRQDNADDRLTPLSISLGLAGEERAERFQRKRQHIQEIIDFCQNTRIHPGEINTFLESIGTVPLHGSGKLYDLISRPSITLSGLSEKVPTLKSILDGIGKDKEDIIEATEVAIKYQGYIRRERDLADKMKRLESIHIKGHFDYDKINQLSTEARQKLSRIDPETLAQASRIPGVSPSDISALLILMGR